jgi:hypothetical protein
VWLPQLLERPNSERALGAVQLVVAEPAFGATLDD